MLSMPDTFTNSSGKLDIKDTVVFVTGQSMGDDCAGTGVCQVVEGEKKSVSLAELAEHAHLRNKQFIGIGRIVPENAPPWHAHFAEVEVDTETGQVRVIKMAAVHDVGKAIHPAIVEGQIEGGVLQGVGYALSEDIRYNEKGKQLHDSFHKYMLPTAEDVPEIDASFVEAADPSGPLGGKGVGECGLVPTAPAITNAIYDPTSIRSVKSRSRKKRSQSYKERGLKSCQHNREQPAVNMRQPVPR